jgi:glutathione S-transferase
VRHRRSTGRAARPLHELVGDAFEVEIVPLLDAVQYTPDYLRRNPNHCVPTLEITMEDGASMHMTESGAMVALLADAFRRSALRPGLTIFYLRAPTTRKCCILAPHGWT